MPFLKSGCKGTNKLTIIKWQLTIIQNFNIFYAQESLHILTFVIKLASFFQYLIHASHACGLLFGRFALRMAVLTGDIDGSEVVPGLTAFMSHQVAERQACGKVARQSAVELRIEKETSFGIEHDNILRRHGVCHVVDALCVFHDESARLRIDGDNVIERHHIVFRQDVYQPSALRPDNGIEQGSVVLDGIGIIIGTCRK